MSYILEALKKAQAERQLGATPSIDAVSIQVATPGREAARAPLLIGAAAALLLAAVAALVWWRQSAPAPQVASLGVTPVVPQALPAPVAVNPPAPMPPPVQPAVVIPPPLPAPPVAAPVRARQEHAAVPAALQPIQPPPARPPAPQSVAAPAPEESLPFARELPEQIRGTLPQVAMGGYMYSPNPTDRMVIIDKILRREGEEVSPGLMLEKLLPKAAVLNYRGTRYRVPY